MSLHSATLSWTASIDAATIAGYNAYRGTKSGGPYTKLNLTPITGLVFVDQTFIPGQDFYYALTSVTPTGVESVFSAEVHGVLLPAAPTSLSVVVV
jgi:hypothetical protein